MQKGWLPNHSSYKAVAERLRKLTKEQTLKSEKIERMIHKHKQKKNWSHPTTCERKSNQNSSKKKAAKQTFDQGCKSLLRHNKIHAFTITKNLMFYFTKFNFFGHFSSFPKLLLKFQLEFIIRGFQFKLCWFNRHRQQRRNKGVCQHNGDSVTREPGAAGRHAYLQ